jgi:hypothetical protein
MAIAFLISYQITRFIIKDREKKQTLTNHGQNLRGGSVESENREIIVSCVENGKTYLVTDQGLANVIMSIAKEKFKNNSYIISENLVRYIALKLKSENFGFLIKVKNAIMFSDNPIRFISRISAALIIGSITAVTQMIPYAILLMILTFHNTAHCGIKCDKYFTQVESHPNQTIVV